MSEEETEGHWGQEHPQEFQRALAERILKRIDQHQQFVFDQVGSMAKWLMASLLAVNGAGAIAAMNAVDSGKGHWAAGLLFAVGVGCALMSGVAMQDVYNAIPEPLLTQDNYWTGVSITGERDGGVEELHKTATAKMLRFRLLPPLLGWISGLLFIAGAITLAFHVEADDRANKARCLSIQNDMLSAQPQRRDGIELFRAFGCMPAGTGKAIIARPTARPPQP